MADSSRDMFDLNRQMEPPGIFEVLRLAGEQYGLVTRSQLRKLGMTSRKIDIRIRNRRLLPVANGAGVYAVGRPIESRRAKCMAATLIAGEGSMLAGSAAAELWGLLDYKGAIEVVRAESRKPRELWLEGEGVVGRVKIVVRRSRHLPDGDRTRQYGIPVMNTARLFVDLSARLPDKPLYDAFKQADMKGVLNREELLRCTRLGRGWKGIRRFRRLVYRRHPDMKDARSHREGGFIDICRDFNLGRPIVNRRKGRYYPDFFFEDSGLLVEVEGAEVHSGRLAFLDDTRRENELRTQVRQLIRFSSEEIELEREKVAMLVRQEQTKCLQLKRLEESAA